MIEEIGTVIDIDRNFAVIEVNRKEACHSCKAKSFCHPFDEDENLVQIIAKNKIDASIGNKVKVAIPETTFLKASFITYLVPIIFLLIGSFIGEIFFNNDFFNFLIGGIFFIISFFIIHSYSKKKGEEYLPVIIEKL